jgi:hypothetical protein
MESRVGLKLDILPTWAWTASGLDFVSLGSSPTSTSFISDFVRLILCLSPVPTNDERSFFVPPPIMEQCPAHSHSHPNVGVQRGRPFLGGMGDRLAFVS